MVSLSIESIDVAERVMVRALTDAGYAHTDGVWLAVAGALHLQRTLLPEQMRAPSPALETWAAEDMAVLRRLRDVQLRDMGELRQSVRARDRHLCRYCGVRVIWGEHRSALGGTFDHVDPDEGNTRENVVVACRRCAAKKKDRTPEQARMKLLSPGTNQAALQ